MTLVRTIISLAIIAVITLIAGVVMSKYQADLMKNAEEYSDLMANIPSEFDVWKRTKTAELPDYALEQLKVSNAKNWTYVNDDTGEKVSVSFLVGPTGRLSVHTPEACMDGRGYTISQNRKREPFTKSDSSAQDDKDSVQSNDVFWRVIIENRGNPDYKIVSYYALGSGKRWWAKEDPRNELAQYPFILKMQVETSTTSSEPNSYNAARNFLKEFLPEVAKVFAETDLEGKYGK